MQLYLKWAVFMSAVGIVMRLIMYAAGISVDPSFGWVQWIGTVIGLGLLFMGVREKKMEDPSSFTFGSGWVATFMICLLTGVITAIWIFVDASFIETEMIDVARKAQEVAMHAQELTQEQIDAAMKVSGFFISPSGFAISTLIAYLFGGAILGLIISPIVKAVGNNAAAEPQTPAGM
jgi:hypothetical protein